jgi:hypothetical protein
VSALGRESQKHEGSHSGSQGSCKAPATAESALKFEMHQMWF